MAEAEEEFCVTRIQDANMFNADAINGKAIRLKLKAGLTLTGTIQSSFNVGSDMIPFLTTENSQRLKQRLGIASERIFAPIDASQVAEFLELIPINAIESYELVETEIKGIHLVTLSGKPVTIPDFQLELKNIGSPGVVKVTLGIPDSANRFEIPFLSIKDGIVEVPVSLSFVSYAREDEKFVSDVSQRLRDHGVVTWFDRRNLLPGDDWEMSIEQGIENSDFVLIFTSRESVDRIGFKNRELMFALKQQSLRPRGKIFLIPILLDDCVPPFDLRDLNWLKVSEENWFERLVQTISPWYIKNESRIQ